MGALNNLYFIGFPPTPENLCEAFWRSGSCVAQGGIARSFRQLRVGSLMTPCWLNAGSVVTLCCLPALTAGSLLTQSWLPAGSLLAYCWLTAVSLAFCLLIARFSACVLLDAA